MILIILFFIFFYNYYIYNLISRVLFFQFPVATSRLPPPASAATFSYTIFVNHHLSHTIFYTHHLSAWPREMSQPCWHVSGRSWSPKNTCLPFRNHSRRYGGSAMALSSFFVAGMAFRNIQFRFV